MEPTRGDYDITGVEDYDKLRDNVHAIHRIESTERQVDALAELLMKGHEGTTEYMKFGNSKVASNTGIFNMNSATDCPNGDSTVENPSETGVCQVPWAVCYAHKTENTYQTTLKKRRLQEFLWDAFGAELWADAFLRVNERKTSAFDYIRVSESGDFRHNGDIQKWNTISRLIYPEIQIYTYSASHKLDWNEYKTHDKFVVNQSNNLSDYGERQFTATYTGDDGTQQDITSASDVPDDMIVCPYEVAKENGMQKENRPSCGDCTHCLETEETQPRDVAVIQH